MEVLWWILLGLAGIMVTAVVVALVAKQPIRAVWYALGTVLLGGIVFWWHAIGRKKGKVDREKNASDFVDLYASRQSLERRAEAVDAESRGHRESLRDRAGGKVRRIFGDRGD